MNDMDNNHTPNTDTWIARVQALLAKAESTNHPEEAETYTAKAQELMAKHAISEAVLNARSGERSTTRPVVRRITIEAPYASAKASLLHGIAKANDVKTIRHTASKNGANLDMSMVGFDVDMDSVESLYASLSIQATRAMLAADPGWEGVRRFRQSFLVGYAVRIAERLAEARRVAQAEYESESGETGTALVLVNKGKVVQGAFKEAFPRTVNTRVSSSSYRGRSSGHQAANRAALGHRAVGGSQRSLGR